MKLGELRHLLTRQGVSLSITPEGKLKYEAPQGLTPEVVDAMKAHRAALLAQVQEEASLGTLPKLPSTLALMVRAASNGSIHGGAALASGRVNDLGEYVLAWAAAYLTGDHRHALERLREAHAALEAKA